MHQLEERLRTLWETSKAFAEATTDYERLLDAVARGLADVVKDGCVVRLLSDDGWLRPVGIHLPLEERIRDPATLADVQEHIAAPHHLSEHDSARRVIESGEPLLIPRLDIEQLRANAAPTVVGAF